VVLYADGEVNHMHDITLLINVAVALVAALLGGLLARRIGLPTLVGYLVAGIIIGPFTPGFVGDTATISELAELGIIFLLFGVGLHFSLRDLWAVRAVAIPGALAQMVLITAIGFGLARWWGMSTASGLVLGVALSISSTVVLLRALMDNGLLNTSHGRVAIGWLVVEDLATVLILVLLPAFTEKTGAPVWQSVGLALLKAVIFAALMLIVGTRFVPWLLLRIAHMRSRELFIITVVVITVGTAVAAAEWFGVSLALGAFLAGVVVSESSTRHQVSAEVLPFRETFTVLFFVSIGMLVNPDNLPGNIGGILACTAVVVVGKAILTLLSGFALPTPAKTILVVAAGRSQIGEFSFLLAQSAILVGIFNSQQYSLVLGTAIFSILLNPFMLRLIAPAEALLRRAPKLWRRLDRHGTPPQAPTEGMSSHVVVVGYGRVGEHIVTVLGRLGIPRLVVELDIGRAVELDQHGVPTLYGDAADSEVLDHAGLSRARALVVTLPDEAACEVVVAAGRHQAPRLPIIARAATQDGVGQLHRLGAQDVILPELEGGLEIMRHTLLQLGYPTTDVDTYAEAVRRDRYDITVSTADERGAVDQLLRASRALGIAWFCISEGSSLIDQPLSEVRLNTNRRSRIIAVLRDGQLIAHPEPGFRLRSNDLVSVIGESGASDGVDGSDGVAIGSLSSSIALEDVLNRPLKPLESENIAEPGHPEPR
jgi:CPA2 family monovalent cation:H+ antiporter-2